MKKKCYKKRARMMFSMEKVVMMVVVLAASLAPSSVWGGSLKSLYLLHAPQNMTAVQGEEVVLECEAAPKQLVKDCTWTKDGAGLEPLSRHSRRGCSLVIYPAQPQDEGLYRCQVSGKGALALLSKEAKVQVHVEPGVPSIQEAMEGDWVEVEQGHEVLLTCESQGGRPYAELQWRDAEGNIVYGHAKEHISRIGESGSFKTVSTLRFNPQEPMVVTCSAHSEAFPEQKKSRPLKVQLVKEVVEEEVRVGAGEDVTLSCGDKREAYMWLLNDREVEGETGNTLEIEDFTPEYDNSLVKCVKEKVGGEARLLKLYRLRQGERKQQDEPRMEEQMQVDQGSRPVKEKKSMFTCMTEGVEEGQPKFVWVEGRLEKRVVTAKDLQGRRYKCRLVPGGIKKVRQVEKKLKVISKDLKRFSRILSKFTAPVDDT